MIFVLGVFSLTLSCANQEAFKNAFRLSLNEFYEEFAIWFDQTPKSEKLKIIDVISRY